MWPAAFYPPRSVQQRKLHTDEPAAQPGFASCVRMPKPAVVSQLSLLDVQLSSTTTPTRSSLTNPTNELYPPVAPLCHVAECPVSPSEDVIHASPILEAPIDRRGSCDFSSALLKGVAG